MAEDSIAYCPGCGRKRDTDTAYCAGCGRRLDIATEPQIREKRWQQAEGIADRATEAIWRRFGVVGRAITKFEALTIFGLWCVVVATPLATLASTGQSGLFDIVAIILWLAGVLMASAWVVALLVKAFGTLFKKRES